MSEVIINNNDWLKITHPPPEEGGSGQVVYVRIKNTNAGTATNPSNVSAFTTGFPNYSDTIGLDVFNSLGMKRVLNWHNCYSFGNGVESTRVGDVFNMPRVTPGVKVSTVFEEYKEEHRKYGLIYSGIYNSTSGINNLNQFVQAEKITKDINPIYGSIQKLHARDTDLITLCEDKVLRILANKDAVYNADGNPQLTANINVLGQTVPFVGEFGISKNPESFVSEAYRSYFTDKQRGAVMRLSKDGLTPISMHGMKDWFRDNLSTNRVNLLGEDNLSSNDNWDHNKTTANAYIENGTATLGYYNNNVHSNQAFRIANFKKINILEIGKKYRLQFDIVSHDGYLEESGGFGTIRINNSTVGGSWKSEGTVGSEIAGNHVVYEWVANREDLIMYQSQLNNTASSYNGITIEEFVGGLRGEDGSTVPYTWHGGSNFYGGIATIANMVLEEVKVEPKIVGSYDDRQDEYNVTIHSAVPKTVSFREDVIGWVSFKSFFPENAISCANDYYTIKDGKLWQHHIPGVNSNTFYGDQTNSSVNVILNDAPGSVKSFHALDYEGSQSRVEGIKNIIAESVIWTGAGTNPDGRYVMDFDINIFSEIVGVIQWGLNSGGPNGWVFEGKQYRNGILIYNGPMVAFDNTNGIHFRRGLLIPNTAVAGDWQVGDIMTTEEQEKTVDHFNSMPKDGWWVSGIETDKQKGSLPEFIEKEGKWFNHIKGIDSEISETTNFGSFDIQGIGIVDSIDSGNNEITFTSNINSSLQIGDTLYFERPSEVLGVDIVDMNENNAIAPGFTIVSNNAVDWDGNNAVANQYGGVSYISNIMRDEDIIADRKYRLILRISNYSGTGDVGGSNNAGVSINARMEANSTYTEDFISDGNRLDLFGKDTNSADITFTVQEIMSGEVFGFSRLESSNIQKAGVVTGLTNDTVTIDTTNGILPSLNDYILFSKNQAINTSSLLGYYADVKLENNSKNKVEIFSLSSEITESSK